MVKRASWLSVTPEPERVLPQSVATLTAGGRPAAAAVDRERTRIERLVLHGSQLQWLRYLHQVVGLIVAAAGRDDPDVVQARTIATVAIANHHNLLLALPGPGAAITAQDRLALDRLRLELESGLNGGHDTDHNQHHQRTAR